MDDTTDEERERTVSGAVLKVLEAADAPLKKDSIAAIIAFENEITVDKALVELLKAGKVEARFKGDKSEAMDTDDFTLRQVDESKTVRGQKKP